MDKVSCCVCGKEKTRNACHIIILTEKEKAQIPDSKDEYTYCKPCWKALANPITGPAFMSGLAQQYLRRLGVSNAEERAKKYHAALLAKTTRKD